MNFDLHLYGETPEELLNVLAHLGHMDSNYHTPIPDERHPAQAPAPQSQSLYRSRRSPRRRPQQSRSAARRSPQRHLWKSSRRPRQTLRNQLLPRTNRRSLLLRRLPRRRQLLQRLPLSRRKTLPRWTKSAIWPAA